MQSSEGEQNSTFFGWDKPMLRKQQVHLCEKNENSNTFAYFA